MKVGGAGNNIDFVFLESDNDGGNFGPEKLQKAISALYSISDLNRSALMILGTGEMLSQRQSFMSLGGLLPACVNFTVVYV